MDEWLLKILNIEIILLGKVILILMKNSILLQFTMLHLLNWQKLFEPHQEK